MAEIENPAALAGADRAGICDSSERQSNTRTEPVAQESKQTAAPSWRDLVTVHPAADAFEPMSEEELNELANDIKANGIRQKIAINIVEGKPVLFDGRNRLEAATRAGLTLFKPDGTPIWDYFQIVGADTSFDPFRYIISLNLRRRHLDASQRAIAAAKIATLRQGNPETGKFAGLPTQAAAASAFNVSERSVRHGREVVEKGIPELVHAVERGEVAVSTAAAIAQKPIEEQRDIVGRPAPAEARRMAKDTGQPVQARDGRVQEARARTTKPAARQTLRDYRDDDAELAQVLRLLQGDRGRIEHIPLAKRITLARAALSALHVTADDLRTIGGA